MGGGSSSKIKSDLKERSAATAVTKSKAGTFTPCFPAGMTAIGAVVAFGGMGLGDGMAAVGALPSLGQGQVVAAMGAAVAGKEAKDVPFIGSLATLMLDALNGGYPLPISTEKEEEAPADDGGGSDAGGGTGGKEKVAYGDHFTKKDGKKALKPNVEYDDGNGHIYTTDDKGRIESVRGSLELKKGDRNEYAQRTVGGEDRHDGKDGGGKDDGGHLIGTQFNGSGEIDNLVPQDSKINRSGGQWFKMETVWKDALKSDPKKTVVVDIKPKYKGDSTRPIGIEVVYWINGEKTKVLVPN
ncbi:MAG: DNA/RNA non-specific endonuclease [Lachnospiraceae bacterium]|jgi:hypothetical protein|nr:DNA/RNA non-specific endonuclease [Lachnospiraceae bacterium]